MKKEFIPYEQALELKELGFNEPCFGWFTNSYLRIGSVVENKHVKGEDEILAPLYQQAFRWFREKHGSFLFSDYGKFPHITIIQNLMFEYANMTYEEAELACLIKLIEVIKTK